MISDWLLLKRFDFFVRLVPIYYLHLLAADFLLERWRFFLRQATSLFMVLDTMLHFGIDLREVARGLDHAPKDLF